MKRLLFVFILTFLFISSYAQERAIKGRFLGIPTIMYTSALTYEQRIDENFGWQVFTEFNGYNFRRGDGSREHTFILAPEIRYYFGKHKTNLNKTAYAAFFTELAYTNIKPAYAFDDDDNPYLEGKRKMMRPGLLIGKHVETNSGFFFDLYMGGKYRFVWQKDEFLSAFDASEIIKTSRPHEWGLRVGFNVGWTL